MATDLTPQEFLEMEEMYKQCSQGNVSPDYIYGLCSICNSEIILTRYHQQICDHFRVEIEKHGN